MTVPITTISNPSSSAAAQGQVARKYQEEIFQQAQKGNVIAYLRTGSGKTLISVLLIRWIATQEKSRGKVIVFFVPKVSLVEQQAQYIEKETGLRVDRLHGSLAFNFSDRQGWKKRFETHDVVVITSQLFIELITHSLWSIDKVSLMVFDECHHARKNHPYNGVMREYAQIKDKSRRPKIFGMTASPYWNEKNPALSLSTLETNLQSKIVGVHEHVEELQANFSRLDEIIQQYPYPPQTYEEYPEPTLYNTLKVFYVNSPDLFDRLAVPWSKIEMRYYMTLSNLGPYCASLYLYSEMQHHMAAATAKAKELLAPESEDHSMNIDTTDPSKSPPLEMFDILEILDDFSSFFELKDGMLPIAVPMNWNSPKIRVLADIIRKNQKKGFQCIIFVEQRQVASCLSKVLEAIPELEGLVRSAHLIGQGVSSDAMTNQAHFSKGDPIKLFREKAINVLIATSVAEEGLDFPECDLVIRFDPLQHLVGYVQSRGRARSRASKYIVMIQQDNMAQLERYRALQQGESYLSQTYHTRGYALESMKPTRDPWDDIYDNTDSYELAERDRIVIPSTGAVLTYDNAMGLLSHLCALIPRDAFTPAHRPVYEGDFQCRMRLPASLPLASKDLVYIGYPKRSKKEARRSVAFLAVKHLLRLNVFNEYLLPVSQDSIDDEDAEEEKRQIEAEKYGDLPPDLMEVEVKDPWYLGEKLWVHQVVVSGREAVGLVTGTQLPPVQVVHDGREVRMSAGSLLPLDSYEEEFPRQIMNDFMRWGVRARNCGKKFPAPQCSFFLVPLKADGGVDFETMVRFLEKGPSYDWSEVTEDMYDHILVMNRWKTGSTYRLKKTFEDLTPMSKPPADSPQAGFETYQEYFTQMWSTKRRCVTIPENGPMLGVVKLPRLNNGAYTLEKAPPSPEEEDDSTINLTPQSVCSWVPFPLGLSDAFAALPYLCRRITDVYRVRVARQGLRLPSIRDNYLIEALTVPWALTIFNNQRLETLGDAVLEVCVTVQLLNQYPNRHEGQLSKLRQQYICNRHLLMRARELGLEHYISCEVTAGQYWRYTCETLEVIEEGAGPPRRSSTVTFARRSLQDCMEALLGAAYLEGGIGMSLKAGTALGLNFGGALPWTLRYRCDREEVPAAPLFTLLQERLGYEFHWNDVLVEAVTHPSFASSDGTSYQRLEFLGDALINLVVVEYLFKKFPSATSHELSYLRAKVICSPTLAFLAITKLEVHKVILANNMDLWKAIDQWVPILESLTSEDIVKRSWRYDPPKAISDVFEGIVGAVLVDSGYNYETAAAVVELVMGDALAHLSPSMATNPIAEVLEWVAKAGCKKLKFRKNSQTATDINADAIVVQVHETVVAGPVLASSGSVGKFIAAERALAVLADPENPLSLAKLCDCAAMAKAEEAMDDMEISEEENTPASAEADPALATSVVAGEGEGEGANSSTNSAAMATEEIPGAE